MLWASKMQSQITLSTTEAEHIALSSALQDVILLMDLAKELCDEFKFVFFVLTLMFFAMLLRITLVHCKSPSFQRCILKPSILIDSIIPSENTWGKMRWCFTSLVWKIKWQICLLNHYYRICSKSTVNLCFVCEARCQWVTHHFKNIIKILFASR